MKKIKILTLGATPLAACSLVTPILLSSCSKSQYAQAGELIKNDAITIFKDVVCSKRHNSYDLRKIIDVYKQYVETILGKDKFVEQPASEYQEPEKETGKEFKSEYGNCYFDIPAAAGCENYKPVIIQAHVDMVEATAAGKSFGDKIELEETVIDGKKAVISKDRKTSIGADNGAGVALMLSMLKNKDGFKHGLIRCLLSADEEPGMVGARYVPESWFKLDPSDKKSAPFEYVINADNEAVGKVLISCAGGYSKSMDVKTDSFKSLKDAGIIEEINSTSENKNIYTITVGGLKSAHSAEVNENMTNALHVATKLIDYLKYSEGSTTSINLVSLKTPNTRVTNEVITDCVLEVASPIQYNKNQIDTFVNGALQYIKENFSDENNITLSADWSELKDSESRNALSVEATKQFIQLVDKFIFGPISYIDKDKKNLESSSNIAPVHVALNGEEDPAKKEEKDPAKRKYDSLIGIKFYSRSCNNKIIQLIHAYNDALYNGFEKIFTTETLTGTCSYTSLAEFPGWAPENDLSFANLFIEGFKQAGCSNAALALEHGGVEPAWWVNKQPTIHAVSVGPTLTSPHTPNETLFLDSFYEEAQAILYVIDKINK